MAGYNEIRGLRVKYLSADPANPENGQVWYNSTTGNLRVEGILGAGTWSSGTSFPVSFTAGSGGGTKTAGWSTSGDQGSAVFLYDGSSWTGTGALNTARNGGASAGTQTAGLVFAGSTSPAPSPSGRNSITEEFNGSVWAEQNDMNQTRDTLGGLGTQTAALGFGGFISGPWPTGSTNAVEEYDGSSWTAVTALPGPAGKSMIKGAGIQTAAITAGGGPSNTNVATEYDGSSWTAASNFPTTTANLSTGGTQTDALCNGDGGTGTQSVAYNGTTWTAGSPFATGRNNSASLGYATTQMAMVGGSPTTAVTEEFTIPVGTATVSVS